MKPILEMNDEELYEFYLEQERKEQLKLFKLTSAALYGDSVMKEVETDAE